MRPIYVDGVGLWTPEFPSWTAWSEQLRATEARDPKCEGVSPGALRGTSLGSRVAIEVALQAMREAGADPTTAATVFASALGEIQTAVVLIRSVLGGDVPSPIRFKNSVHNAASGNLGIAQHNRAFSTAISAGDELVVAGLLEAWTWLDAHGGHVALAFSEEAIPAPLPTHGEYPALGLALHLRSDAGPSGRAVMLSDLRRVPGGAVAPLRNGFAGNACAWALPLVEAVASRLGGTIALGPDPSAPFCVTVTVP